MSTAVALIAIPFKTGLGVRAVARTDDGVLHVASGPHVEEAMIEVSFTLDGAAEKARAILAGDSQAITKPGIEKVLAAALLIAGAGHE